MSNTMKETKNGLPKNENPKAIPRRQIITIPSKAYAEKNTPNDIPREIPIAESKSTSRRFIKKKTAGRPLFKKILSKQILSSDSFRRIRAPEATALFLNALPKFSLPHHSPFLFREER